MRTNIVITLTGTDRIGIVEEITRALLDLGCNVETSRMARLGGEFAILMLVSVPNERSGDVENVVSGLQSEGFKTTISRTRAASTNEHPDWLGYRIEVQGADHEGIVHQIAHDLSARGINIESMDTVTTLAPVSGTPLFAMTAFIAVPPHLSSEEWEEDLNTAGRRLNVDIQIAPIRVR